MEKKIKQIFSFILVLCLMVTYIPLEYGVDFNGSSKVKKVEAKPSLDNSVPDLNDTTYPGKAVNHYAAGYRISIYYYGTDTSGNKYAPNVVSSRNFKITKIPKNYKKKGATTKKGRVFDYFYAYDSKFLKNDYKVSKNDKSVDTNILPATYYSDKMARKASVYVLNTYNTNFAKLYEMLPTTSSGYTKKVKGDAYKSVNKDRIFTTKRGLSKKVVKTLNSVMGNTLQDDILDFGTCYNKDATKMIQTSKLNKIETWLGNMDKKYKTNKTKSKADCYENYINFLKSFKDIDGVSDDFIDMCINDVKTNPDGICSYIQVEPVVALGFNSKHGYVTTYRQMRFASKNGKKAAIKGVFSYRKKTSVPLLRCTSAKQKRLDTFVGKEDNKKKETKYETRYYEASYGRKCNVSCSMSILGCLYQSYMFEPRRGYANVLLSREKDPYLTKNTLLNAGYNNRAGIGYYGLGHKKDIDISYKGSEVNATVNLLYDGEVTEDSLESNKGTWQATNAVTEIVLDNAGISDFDTVSKDWGTKSTADLKFTKYIDSANSTILKKIGPMYQYVKDSSTGNYKATSVDKYSSVGASARKDNKNTKMDEYSTVLYYNYLVTNKKKKNIATISKRLNDATNKQLLAKDSDGNYKLKAVWKRFAVSSNKDSSLNAGYRVGLRNLTYGDTSTIFDLVTNGLFSGDNGLYTNKANYSINSILAYPVYAKPVSGILKAYKVASAAYGDEAIDDATTLDTYIRYRSDVYSEGNAKEIYNRMSAIGSNKALATQSFYLQCLAFKGLLGSQTTTLSKLTTIAKNEQFSLNLLVGAKMGDVSSYYTWAVYDYGAKGLSTSGKVTKKYDISTFANIPLGSYTTTKKDGTVKTNPILGIKRVLIVPNKNNTGKASQDMALSEQELKDAVTSGCSDAESGTEEQTLNKVHSAIVSKLQSKASNYGNGALRQYFEDRLNATENEEHNSSENATVGFYQNDSVEVPKDVDDSSVKEDSMYPEKKPSEDDTTIDTETTVDIKEDEDNDDINQSQATSPEDNSDKYINGIFEAYDINDVSKANFLKKAKESFENDKGLKKVKTLYFFVDDNLKEVKISELDKLSKSDFDDFCEALDSANVYCSKLEQDELDMLKLNDSDDAANLSENISMGILERLASKNITEYISINWSDYSTLFEYIAVNSLHQKVYDDYDTDEALDGIDFNFDFSGDLNNSGNDDENLDGGTDLHYESKLTDSNPAHQRGYTIIAYGYVGKATESMGIDLQPWELNYVYSDLQAAVMGSNEKKVTSSNASSSVLNWNAFVRTHSDDRANTVKAANGTYIYSLTGSRSKCTDGPHDASKEQLTPPDTVFAEVTQTAWTYWVPSPSWGGEDYNTNNIIISDETTGRDTTKDKNEGNGTSNYAYYVNSFKLLANKDDDDDTSHYSLFLYSPYNVNKWHNTNKSYAVRNQQNKHTTAHWSTWSRISKNFNYNNQDDKGYQRHYFTVNTLYETAYFSYVYNLIRYISGDIKNVSDFYNYEANYATVNEKVDTLFDDFIQSCLQFKYANLPDIGTAYVSTKKFTNRTQKNAFTYRFATNESGAKDYISEHVKLQAYMQDDDDNIRYHNSDKNNIDIKDTNKKNQNLGFCDIFYTYDENGVKPFYHYLDENWSSHYNQTIQWTQLVATSAAAEDEEHCHNIPGEYYVYVCDGHPETGIDSEGHSFSYTSYCGCDVSPCSNCHEEYHNWTYDIHQVVAKCYHERCIGGAMNQAFETRIVTAPTKDTAGHLTSGKPEQMYKLNYKEYIYKYVTQSKNIGTTKANSGIAKLTKNNEVYVSGKSKGESATGALGSLQSGAMDNSHISTNFASAYLDSGKNNYSADKYGVTSSKAIFAYYPEVNMLAYAYGKGQKIGDVNGVSTSVMPFIVPTVAEVERASLSGSLNIMSIKGADYDNKDSFKRAGKSDFVGTTMSDSVATSTAAQELGKNTSLFNSNQTIKQVIYAGSDVTISGNSNFKLTLYGYAMDLIKPEDGNNNLLTVSDGNGSVNTMAEGYNYIVRDGATNLYQLWYNNIQKNKDKASILPINFAEVKDAESNYKTLLNRYQAWVNQVTNLNNWSADYTLHVHDNDDPTKSQYSSKFTDFSATIGNLTTGDGKKQAYDRDLTKQTNVYPLHVKNGELIETDAGYVAFINQLARDYFGNTDDDVTTNMVTLSNGKGTAAKLKDYDRANELFKNSDLATCVESAIESSISKENVSGTASNRRDTKASSLGTSASTDKERNWYDEEVRTIVIRRFKTESLYFNNITASDKIDYNTAPTSKTTLDTWTGRKADWYLNLSYKDTNTNPKLGFNTSTVSDTNVAQNFEVIRNLYVDNASFIIPSATTDNMGW